MSKLFTDGKANAAYWDRYTAIVRGIKEANLKHPHSADIHAMVRLEGRTVEQIVEFWGSDRLNRA